MKKKILFLLSAVIVFANILVCGYQVNATEDDKSIYDYADALSDSEESDLLARINVLQESLEIDIIILVTSGMDIDEWSVYTNDFFNEKRIEYERENDGTVYISIEVDNKQFSCGISGHAGGYFGADKSDDLYINTPQYIKNSEYYQGCDYVLSMLESELDVSMDVAAAEEDLVVVETEKSAEVITEVIAREASGFIDNAVNSNIDKVSSNIDSDDERVFDYADILSNSQEDDLFEKVGNLQDKHKMDIIILTSPDIEGKSWEAYADDFYDEHAFGYEQEHGTGIIFLISMDSRNRGITITTSGNAIENFTDIEIEWMYDDIIEYMYDADYYGGCKCFLDLVDDYVDNSEVAENGYYDEDTNDWVETSASGGLAWKRAFSFKSVLIRLLISAAVGGVVVLILRSKAKTKATVNNSTYLENGRLNYTVRSDVYTGTTETRRRLPDSSSGSRSGGGVGGHGHSSVHRSSGGHSHGGGGGRRF